MHKHVHVLAITVKSPFFFFMHPGKWVMLSSRLYYLKTILRFMFNNSLNAVFLLCKKRL